MLITQSIFSHFLWSVIYAEIVLRKSTSLRRISELRPFWWRGGGTVGTVLNHQIRYLGGYYGNVALFYISAFATILGVCYFCRCLPNILHSTYLGANTMAVLVMHKFLVMFFLVCPGIKTYTVYTHPLFCAALSIINMGLCYLAGWVVGHNKMLSKILFGK